MECVLQSEASRPSFSTHPWKIRLYCRVDMCRLVPIRDRNKKSLLCKLPSFINAATASLVPLVISNCTGLPVFCCNTVALLETELNRAFYLPVQAGFGSPRYEISEVVFFGRWYGLCSTVTCSYSNLLQCGRFEYGCPLWAKSGNSYYYHRWRITNMILS